MTGEIEVGRCDVCGKNKIKLCRRYYRYDIKCECHSPCHFEIVWHCENCVPQEPKETKIFIKTENLKRCEND